MDGTFDATPPFFRQLFTIHVMVQNRQLPVVYALMMTKTRNDYVDFFRSLKDEATRRQLRFNPTLIVSDFESGLIPAVREEFPYATHRGCYFHHTQAIFRQVQQLGLQQTYRDDENLRSDVRQLMALGFVPVGQIRVTFNMLRQRVEGRLGELFDYFENFWINNMPHQMWNVYGVERRTNNDLEGWHHRFNAAVQKHRPHIFYLIECFQNEQASTEIMLQQIYAGQRVNRPSPRYNAVNVRIAEARRRFNNGEVDVFGYLRAISYNLALH